MRHAVDLPEPIDLGRFGLSSAGALLPPKYEAARDALASLERIDECKDWADRAEALRSYAKQADDPTLLAHAMRVKARAVRRCGELLAEIAPSPGARTDQPREGALHRSPTRKAAATMAGLTEHQQKESLRVAAVPQKRFESAVEAVNPPTITELANMGRKRRAPKAEPEMPSTPEEADRAIRYTAQVLSSGLIDPDPEVIAFLRPALPRASAADRAIIARAAEFLKKLTEE